MLGKKPSMIRASTSVRLNVNPYLGTAGKPSTRTKVVAGRPRGDAKIAFSVFIQKAHWIVWLFGHDSPCKYLGSSFVACWHTQNG